MVKYSLILGFLVLFLSSCTEIIDMEFTTDYERVVVDATIMNQDTLQYINLSKINLDNSDSIVSPISGADVIINDGTKDIIFTESALRKGLYLSPNDFIGEAGKTYDLKISNTKVKGVDGTDVYLASSTMAAAIKMDSVTSDYIYKPQFGQIGFNLQCWAQEPSERNYYLFKAWRNGVIITDTLYEFNQSDDAFYNGTYLSGIECQFLSDYKADEFVVSGDSLSLEIDNIDEGYYDYLNSAQDEDRGSNPLFGGPPANVTSNVSNGAVGVFRVFTVSKLSVYIEEADRSENPDYSTEE